MTTASGLLVSAILATRRPDFLPGAVRMVRAQAYGPVELAVALHGHPVSTLPEAARAALDATDRVLELPAEASLEACLDEAVAVTRGDILAKIDDDDLYGPAYLVEAVAALAAGLGDVVGKTELYVHLVTERELLLWRPGAAHAEQDYVMGGTLVLPRGLGVSFQAAPGEATGMSGFLERCRAAGGRVYATSRRHHVHRRFRQEHHTWRPDLDLFRSEGVLIRRDVGDDPSGLLRLVG